jgi:hypothetical protein
VRENDQKNAIKPQGNTIKYDKMKGRAEGMRKNKCGSSVSQKWAAIVQIKGRSVDINKDLMAPDRAVKRVQGKI